MSGEETRLSSLMRELKKRIELIKSQGSAFVVDWSLIELIEKLIEYIEKSQE